MRKFKKIDSLIRKITKRDWYKTVSLRFYDENIDSTVIITKKDKTRYLGVLNGAPDDFKDNCLILNDPHIILEIRNKIKVKYSFQKLAAISILVNMTEVDLIEVVKQKENDHVRKKTRFIGFLQRKFKRQQVGKI